MRNTIRCCISCILPCGALDVIRIVHSDGRVEEMGGGRVVSAAEIMKAYPKHVLKKPTSRCPIDESAPVPRIVVVPPDALLKRGRIYFLIPVSVSSSSSAVKKPPIKKRNVSPAVISVSNSNNEEEEESVVKSERYLREVMREKVSPPHRERRRGRVGVWRPNLESISESSSTTTGDQ